MSSATAADESGSQRFVGELAALAADPAAVEAVLIDGAERARTEARKTMALVREAVGMKPSSVG